MMKLRYAKTSPFVRKVLVFADEVGQADRIELRPTDVWADNSDIAKDNPLGKVPALVTREGVFTGSFACCDYLDRRNGAPKLIPDASKERWRVMQVHGLADGMMEAAVAYIIETLRRPKEYVYSGYLDRQMTKIRGALGALEGRLGDLGAVDLGSITAACALGYLDLRLADHFDWRAEAPALAKWYAKFAKRPSMQKTRPDI
ncbi:MAG: glutathione S-transferase family protein [Rhodoblastus sp.]